MTVTAPRPSRPTAVTPLVPPAPAVPTPEPAAQVTFTIDGIETTVPLFLELLKEPDIINGDYNIHWLEHFLERHKAK